MVVDLPDAVGPTISTNSPGRTLKVTCRRTSTPGSYPKSIWSKTISPRISLATLAFGLWTMALSVLRIAWIRSAATFACATEFAIFARSRTGLKNLVRYERKTVSTPAVIAPARISAAPRQRTNAVHADAARAVMGARSDLTRRAFRADSRVEALAAWRR